MFQFQDFMTGWSVAWAKVLFKETNESYGYIRLTKYLHAQGIEISQYRPYLVYQHLEPEQQLYSPWLDIPIQIDQ